MPVLVDQSSANVPCTETSPIIPREGVFWTGGTGGAPLRLELTFANPSALPTAPTTARVEVADFGAFLPWKPLVRVNVPGLPPGGSGVVTAIAGGDARPPRNPAGFAGLAKMVHLMSRASVHFVGNLNVYVSRCAPVERHLQRAVGLRPGQQNLAFFSVGDGRPDAYSFHIGEQEPGWEMELFGMGWGDTERFARREIGLSVAPCQGADSGRASVVVERHSTGERVPVEFEMEATASATCGFF